MSQQTVDPAFQSFAEGQLASRYLAAMDHDNPFAAWLIDQRYWHASAVTELAMNAHHGAAVQCREGLETMDLDGVNA